jgi:hypothetical protein
MMTSWQFRIHNRKALDFYDINRTAEDIAMMLLDEIYGLKLDNLNKRSTQCVSGINMERDNQ